MKKNILSPQSKIINLDMDLDDNTILTDGLVICLDKITKFKTFGEVNKYLMFGSNSVDIKEEIARLILIATTLPKNEAPTINISRKVLNNHIVDINSMFLKEFLELAYKNRKDSFMKSEFYSIISQKVKEIYLKYNADNVFSLGDGIVVMKNIRNLYIANLDQNLALGRLDLRYRELLIELFQYNLDFSLEKIRKGVVFNERIQIQTRH